MPEDEGGSCRRCAAWADVVQIYGDQVLIDAVTNCGLWPEQWPEKAEEANDA